MIDELSSIDDVAQSEARPNLSSPHSFQLCVDAADPAFQAALLIIALLLMAVSLFALESCRRSQSTRRAE